MKNILIAILFTFIFSACASKDIEKKQIPEQKIEKQVKKTQETEEIDEFAEEFGDEFTEEETKEAEVYDPFSGYNRAMTSFNDFVFINVLNPVAKGYSYVVPEQIRIGISNMFNNLMFPVRFTNNVLQLKFSNASEELGRFVVNSTFGVFGFFDPAKYSFNMKAHPEDFGQTLGHYGVGSGPHIVLPFFGPSNLRDTLSLSADFYLDPTSSTGSGSIAYKIPDNLIQSAGITSFRFVNTTSLRLGQYENIKKDAIDLYPFLRDVYEQSRKKAIEE